MYHLTAGAEHHRTAPCEPPEQRLRRVVVFSIFLGLLAGLGEGLIDLTLRHFHVLAILYVTVGANVAIFLILGIFFAMLGWGLKPQLASFLVLFVLFWVLLHGWQGEVMQDAYAGRNLIWLLGLIATGLLAVLLSFWVLNYEQHLVPILARTLPWVSSATVACLLTVSLFGLGMQRRAKAGKAPRRRSPNVVLIIIDTLRADHLSSYHYPRATSPNIDQIAANGTLFENAIATSSWTLPSHASMLTGLYPAQHGAQAYQDDLRADVPTIAEALSRAGYNTAAFSASPYFARQQGLGRGFVEFGDFFYSPLGALYQEHYAARIVTDLNSKGVIKTFGWPSALEVNASASDWLGRTDLPFFLVLNYFEVHEPEMVPQEWHGRFATNESIDKRAPSKTIREGPQDALQIRKRTDDYDDAISYVDYCVRLLIDDMGRRGLLNSTLVILTADHGEGLGEHGLFSHGTTLYYSTIHVPLIFYWPAHVPAAFRVTRPISTRDLPATILDLVGVSASQIPGDSVAVFWGSKTPSQWPPPVSELLCERNNYSRSFDRRDEIESIVSPEFQFIIDRRNGPLLYDWRTDPQELNNLSNSPSYEPIFTELSAELKRAD